MNLTTRKVQLTSEQTAALARAADAAGLSKSQLVDDMLGSYLGAFKIRYSTFPRENPGKRRRGNTSGMHSFAFTPDQQQAIDRALAKLGGISFAQLFEAAAARWFGSITDVSLIAGVGAWPLGRRPEQPYGRPRQTA